MKNKLIGLLSCIFVIIGVIIGAGFASGKEIYTFFYIYGKFGILSLIISMCLIGILIYKTLKLILKYDLKNYNDFLDILIKNNKFNIKKLINIIFNVFLLISFWIMCAGFSAYFTQEFGINIIIPSIFMAVFSYLILNKNIKGIVILNFILIPIIIGMLLILGKFVINEEINFNIPESNYFWIFSSMFYASYNAIDLVSILIPMKKYIKSKGDIIFISIIIIFIIIILGLIIFALLGTIDIGAADIDLPIIYACGKFGANYKLLYGIIVLFAIITTAISSAYGFLNNVSKNKGDYKTNCLLICLSSIVINQIGFSNMVNTIYPLFGAIGIIQVVAILGKKET